MNSLRVNGLMMNTRIRRARYQPKPRQRYHPPKSCDTPTSSSQSTSHAGKTPFRLRYLSLGTVRNKKNPDSTPHLARQQYGHLSQLRPVQTIKLVSASLQREDPSRASSTAWPSRPTPTFREHLRYPRFSSLEPASTELAGPRHLSIELCYGGFGRSVCLMGDQPEWSYP